MVVLDRSSIFLQDPNPSGGKVCLLLHGLGTDSKSWVYQMKALSDRGYRPIAPDLPGFGKSKFYGRKWSVNGVTAELKDVISEKKIEKIILIGLSLGGVFALRFIIDYPEFVEKAILVNTLPA